MKINLNNNKIKSIFLLSLVGSNLAKEENAKNQTEITLNSLPQIGTNLTERQDNSDPTLIFGGYPVSVGVDTVNGKINGYCTAGFSLINTNSSECKSDYITYIVNDYGGFITSGSCFPSGSVNLGTASPDVYNWDGSLLLGSLNYMGVGGSLSRADLDVDYIYTSCIKQDGVWVNIKLIPYVMGEKELVPITGLGSVTIGSRVCAYGAVSGYNCGKVVEINSNLESRRPTNKVDLESNGFYVEGDLGGPVYVESGIGDRTTAQALGFITRFDNNDPNHKFLYYTPLDRALKAILGSEMSNCNYALMTYNETNAQQYDHLLAQMEIPAKK